jgi:hypothetical protein
MTPFVVGQAVTFPHMSHMAGGVIEEIREEDGARLCLVRNQHGTVITWREDALYAKTAERERAQAAAMPPAPQPNLL